MSVVLPGLRFQGNKKDSGPQSTGQTVASGFQLAVPLSFLICPPPPNLTRVTNVPLCLGLRVVLGQGLPALKPAHNPRGDLPCLLSPQPESSQKPVLQARRELAESLQKCTASPPRDISS